MYIAAGKKIMRRTVGMENQKKKDVNETKQVKKKIDADAADTLIQPLDELDLEPMETDSDDI
jgi:hypothetical protein